MEVVLDTSVLLAVLANEPEREIIVERTRGCDILSPQSVHWEIGNALSAMLKKKRIQLKEAKMVIEAYLEIPIRFIDVSLRQALEISAGLKLYAYDAYLIACCVQQMAPLMSLDKNLIMAAKKYGTEILEI